MEVKLGIEFSSVRMLKIRAVFRPLHRTFQNRTILEKSIGKSDL